MTLHKQSDQQFTGQQNIGGSVGSASGARSIANMFSTIYGDHSMQSGVLAYLIKMAYIETVKKVKAVNPGIVNLFANTEVEEDTAFTNINIDALLANVYDFLSIMFNGIFLKKVNSDRLNYLLYNNGSIYGGNLTPCYAIEWAGDYGDTAKNMQVYPEALESYEGDWRFFYIPKNITITINDTEIPCSPNSLFSTIIKQAAVIQMETDLTTFRNNFINNFNRLNNQFTEDIEALVELIISVSEDIADKEVIAEFTALTNRLTQVNDSLTKINSYVSEEDAEMVQATVGELNAILSSIQSDIGGLSNKWTTYTSVSQSASQSASTGLQSIAAILGSMQGSIAAYVQGITTILERKKELNEQIIQDIEGA